MKINYSECSVCGARFSQLFMTPPLEACLTMHSPGGRFPEEVEPDKMCNGCDKMPHQVTITFQKFEVGNKVTIVRLLDGMTSRQIIGISGLIEEVEGLVNGDFNYRMAGGHYMHEEELEFSSQIPVLETGMSAS